MTAATALAGAVVALDLLWSLLVGSTGHLAYGFFDEPAHLATCVVALLALGAVSAFPSQRRFAVAALVASVAIDVDHIPGLLGWNILSGSLPRPYPHSLVLVAALVAAGCLSRRRDVRQISLGIAFGVSAHLLRDLATGPGVPLLWPALETSIRIPYGAYLGSMAMALLVAARASHGARGTTRLALTAMLAVLATGAIALAPTPAAAQTISVGAFIPGVERDPSLIDSWTSETGRPPVFVGTYRDWASPLIDTGALEGIDSRGAVPMITWEPWEEDEAPVTWESNEIPVPLWSIAAGSEDAYIRESAREAADWGKPLLLRFAHEMNGNWYPWGWGVGDGSPASFKAAWRHVVGIFRAEGATNVRWVWCPYVSNTRPGQFRRFYPGNQWVDWACVDGFNWGTYRVWQSFNEIFARTYHQLIELTARPIMIGEMGVSQAGGNKARWVSSALRRYLPRYRHVRAVLWWSEADDRADFRVDSSPSALAAFRSALAENAYASSARQLLDIPRLLGQGHHKRRGHRHTGRGGGGRR